MTTLSHQEHPEQIWYDASCRPKWGIGTTVTAVKVQCVSPPPLLNMKRNKPFPTFYCGCNATLRSKSCSRGKAQLSVMPVPDSCFLELSHPYIYLCSIRCKL